MNGTRRLVDRVLTMLARVALRGFFRELEVDGTAALPPGRPVLVVANHFNGFIDPVMLMHVFGRLPRFLARATLWDMVLARPFLALAGMIPVHRPQDGSDARSNLTMFADCTAVLAQGGVIGIFPEGETHDDSSIHGLRTGAARIALGAHRDGVRDLLIVPAGLLFTDKVALRSRVLARVGRPLEVDELVAELEGEHSDPSDRVLVRALTRAIDQRLREAAPDYRSQREAKVLRRAAQVSLRTGDDAPTVVSLAAQEQLARRLAAAPETGRVAIADALAHYHLDLELAGLGDEQVEAGRDARTLLRRTALVTLRLLLLAPLALVGAVWNLLPYWLVKLVGRLVTAPVTKGTARLVTALIAFPLSWTATVLTDGFRGFLPGLLVFLLAPLLGIIAVGWLEALVGVHRDWRDWIGLTERRALLAAVEQSRTAVVTAVSRALEWEGDDAEIADTPTRASR